jgi:hypothetical protein
MAPPIKTTVDDIDALFAYLKTQVGWVPLEKVRKTIDGKYADLRKIGACAYLGLVERDGGNVKLSESGHRYANGDEAVRAQVLRDAIRQVPLYFQTVEWIYHGKRDEPNRNDVGNYWHDKQQDQLDGAKDAALTDAVIFFFRVAGAAGLGKFIPAGNGRPVTFLRADQEEVAEFVTGTVPAAPEPKPPLSAGEGGSNSSELPPTPPLTPSLTPPPAPAVTVQSSPAVHINLEIHIAADATAETVEEIFKNMRKYVLSDGS